MEIDVGNYNGNRETETMLRIRRAQTSSTDPYLIWKKRVYAWLLCVKHNPHIRDLVGKHVALLIAHLIELDLSDACIWTGESLPLYLMNTNELGFIWKTAEYDWFFIVCRECFRPCFFSYGYICLKHGLTRINSCKKCSSLIHGGYSLICKSCFYTIASTFQIKVPLLI